VALRGGGGVRCDGGADQAAPATPSGQLAARSPSQHGAEVAPKRKRERSDRRARARAHEQLVRDLDRLARLEPGGAPDRPIAIDTPAVVDLRAVAKPCPLCGGSLKVEAHTAEVIDGARLRVANVACTQCGARRAIYFRLTAPSLH
jgi:hypothetical protein